MKTTALCALLLLSAVSQASELLVDPYREQLRSSPSGPRIGVIERGVKLKQLEQKGDWVKISVEGWMWKESTRTLPTEKQQDATNQSLEPPSSRQLLIPRLLNKGYAAEDLQELVWFDLEFDTTNLPGKTRAIKGALIVSDLFDEPIMRIYWTINKPLTPGESFIEKGTNFAYNEFLGHHQWVRYTAVEDMKVSFEVRNIIFEDGSRQNYYR